MTDDKPRRRRRRKKRPVKWKGGRSRPKKDYRSEEYIQTIAKAETGIYMVFVLSDYQLTDHDVRRSVKTLIRELRGDGFVAPEERDVIEIDEESREDIVTWAIKANWERLFDGQPRHSDEDLVGCLGVVLSSIETWSTPAPNSRGYLWYSAAFIQNLGVSVELVPESEEDELMWEEEEETDEDILRELAEEWLDYPDPKRFHDFQRKAREMLDDRQAQEVINVCQYLIGWTNDEAVIERLVPFLQPAYRQLGVPFQYPSSLGK